MSQGRSDQLSPEQSAILASLKTSVRAQLAGQLGREPGEELVEHTAQQAMAQLIWKEAGRQKLSRDEAHKFWREEGTGGNVPERYADASPERSEFLCGLINKLSVVSPAILEIGCNCGRNLACLYDNGYNRLTGIDISAQAIALLRERYPGMAVAAKIFTAPVEDIILDIQDSEFDVVYSMAVLVHIHPESDWIMAEIARITGRFLITIEDETTSTLRHFQRNYREVFEGHGLRQVSEHDVSWIEGLGTYTARVFTRDRGDDC
jgi:SAM-dependent methyltransferase